MLYRRWRCADLEEPKYKQRTASASALHSLSANPKKPNPMTIPIELSREFFLRVFICLLCLAAML